MIAIPPLRPVVVTGIFVFALVSACQGQQIPAFPSPSDATVKLDANGEMELRSLVEYIAQRTGVRYMYDQSLVQRKVNIVVPDPIPVSSLPAVLQSVLRVEGLVIADAGVEGWKRIVPIERIPEVAKPTDEKTDLSLLGAAEAVTRVFTLKSSVPSKIAELVQPTMSKNGASIVAVDNQRILIVTDLVDNIRRVAQLIELLDTGKPLVDVKFVAVKHVKAEELAASLRGLLDARLKALGKKEGEASGIEVSVEARTNQLILIGNVGDIAQAEELLRQLDQKLETKTATFNLQYVSPERFDELIRSILEGRAVRPPFETRIEGTALIVDSTPEVLALAQQIQRQFDTRQAPADQSPIRFYNVKNVPAQELLETIQSIFSGKIRPERRSLPDRSPQINQRAGLSYPPVSVLGPMGPVVQNPILPDGTVIAPIPNAVTTNNLLQQPIDTQVASRQTTGDTQISTNFSSDLIGEAQVTVDVHTNSIIVVAKPEVQRIYASLIEQLDKRRPQVLVEAKVVIIDTSDNFTLGVEVSGGDRRGDKKNFAFTSYGFSQVSPSTGALTITPGVGFNGTLVDPSTADVVVRALSTHRRARVQSSPRILVNDNAEGELTSVLEVPFTSVNASQTVSTTSFAGFAQAGTTITVTPTISDDNYLQLDYTVTLNSFTGDGAAGIPPPRQTNEVRSRVTVPDGYTVIVGGLTSKNDTLQYRGLPWLEKIPVVRDLTGTTSNSWSQTSLFIFLRPVILRDDKFKDLKYISDGEMCEACLQGEFPATKPLSIP